MNKIPNNDPPALINSLFSSRINAGGVNMKNFYLTLLDLINRKYISVKIISKNHETEHYTRSDSKHWKTLDKIILKINRHSTDKLHPFERNVLKCISTLKYKGNINILDTEDTIKKRLKVNTFQKNYDNWIKNFYGFLKNSESNLFNNSKFSWILGINKWTKEGKELKIKWDLFKNYYKENLMRSNQSKEFLNGGINHIPHLLSLGIPKDILINNFSQSTNITDAFLFLKYAPSSLIENIVKDFLRADSSFDPKYYNTSGNFVPGGG